MARGRKRKGTLSDLETLRLYEGGVHAQDIAQREGITAGGVLSRVSNARAERREGVKRHQTAALRVVARNARQPRPVDPPDERPLREAFAGLRDAIVRLEAQARQHA